MDIFVGAWGWKHDAWGKDQFYPDDLPADWRLSYYSNEFDMVVIPADYWASGDLEQEDWLDDVDDEFEFYLQWPLSNIDDSSLAKCLAFIDEAGDQVVALLIDQLQWLDATEQQRQVLEELSGKVKVRYYQAADAPSSFVCEDEQMISSSDILLLCSDENESLRELTVRLQTLIKKQAIKRIILMPAVEADEPSMARLKELATLVALLAT